MLTIVIPNRNRNLTTVQRTLASLAPQLNKEIQAVVVDYGSEEDYQVLLKEQIDLLDGVEGIYCPTQDQLWQKTRAINIALKQCETPFFMVADMDMIFHPQFVEKAMAMTTSDVSYYFQVGILTEEESKLQKQFEDYQIKFKTNEGATGITMFPTHILKKINGFDEFYHGWGAEDTDVHVRLQNAGYTVNFYDEECLFLHQWHPKSYRSKKATTPFHPLLEKINHSYLQLTKISGKIQANEREDWGVLPAVISYAQLDQPEIELTVFAAKEDVEAFLAQLTSGAYVSKLNVDFIPHPKATNTKEKLKKALGKNTPRFLKMEEINEVVLSTIIKQLRNKPYRYSFSEDRSSIRMQINLR